MLLAIDIGNTHTNLGLFNKEELLNTWCISSSIHQTADEYALAILELLKHNETDSSSIKEIAICSVVPALTTTFQKLSEKYFHIRPLVIAAGIKTGIKIRIDNPKEVGADRIANAVAVHKIYNQPVIAVDMGTATTFDVVNADGDYLGGAIAPGIDMASELMSSKTSLLPHIDLVDTPNAIGKSTITAMQSGLLYGYVGLIEGIISKIKNEMNCQMYIIATGGSAEILSRHTPVFDEVDKYLTLKGIQIINELNK